MKLLGPPDAQLFQGSPGSNDPAKGRSLMQSSFLFKTAVMARIGGANAEVSRLDRAVADLGGDEESRFRLLVFGKAAAADSNHPEVPLFTLELSEAEAFTFSEWLDSAVTSPPSKDHPI